MSGDLLKRFRRSLTLKLLVPALAVGALIAVVAGVLLYAQFKAHARDEMTRWAVSLADSVNYAAETSNDLADLERFVTALGAEPNIRTIVVVAGQPRQVLASTRMAWWRHPLAELPDADIRRHLEAADGKGAHAHWTDEPPRLLTTVPLRIHQPEMDPGRLAAGTVYVELDARPELARQRSQAALAGGALASTVVLLTLLGLGLIQSRVVRPVRAIQGTVERRREGDSAAYAPVASDDEIGLLAGATNRLLDAQAEREALFRQMFSAHPAVQFLLDADSGTIVDLNAAAEAFYGYPREELLGQSISRINNLTPADLDQVMARVRSQGSLEGQFQHRLASGELREVMIQTGLMKVAGRTYLNSIVHDVTEANRYRRQLETYRHLFHNVPVGMFRSSTGQEGRFLELNPTMAELFEAESLDELQHQRVVDLYRDPADRQAVLQSLGNHGEVRRRELRMRSLKGRAMWCTLTAHLDTDEHGTTFIDGVFEDITERKEAEADRDRLAEILEATPDFIGISDPQGNELYRNRGAWDMLKQPPRSDPSSLPRDSVHPEWAGHKIREEGIPAAIGQGSWSGETAVIDSEGNEIPVSQVILAHYGPSGQVQRLSTIMRDISKRKALEGELEHQATHDRLTGVFNRLKFEELLEQEAERAGRYGTHFALIMLDIDRFKAVNDTYGHDAGDAILRQLTHLVGRCLRSPDTLARWGGEEFMVLLPETNREGAAELAERLRQAAAGHDFPGPGQVTISLGVAEHQPGEVLKTLLKRVDDALYRAKESGRDRVELAPTA